MFKPLFLLLSFVVAAHAQLAISEFLATNSNSIADEDGNNEDWIEVQNTSAGPINLAGWYLTDDRNQPRRWAFPNWTLNPGGYVVVFASDKYRKPAQATAGQDNPGTVALPRLHANFKLSADGEYLALTKDEANGSITVSQLFDPYPPQTTDLAYGTQVATTLTPLIAPGAAAKFLVPRVANGGDLLPYSAWTGTPAGEPFDDSTWTAATTAMGFANNGIPLATLKLRLNANTSTTVATDNSPALHDGANTGVSFVATSTDAAPKVRHGAMLFGATDSNSSVTGDLITVAPHADFNSTVGTICFWFRSSGLAGAGNDAIIFDRRAGTGVGVGMVLFQGADGRITFQPGNGAGGTANQFSTSVGIADDRWHHVALVYSQANGTNSSLYIDGVLNAQQASTAAWTWNTAQQLEIGRSHDPYWRPFNGQLDDVRVYTNQLSTAQIASIFNNADDPIAVGTSLITPMVGTAPSSASVFIRIPFNVTDASVFDSVHLTMKWSDGFVAWINGVQVGTFGAPTPPLYNSLATLTHSYGAPFTIPVPTPTSTLRMGTNILAIQALNNATTNAYFAVLPQIDGVNVQQGVSGYLSTPTPGNANSNAKTNLGPFVSAVTNNPSPRPTGTAASPPLVIIARVLPSLRPLAAAAPVQLKYRVMFNAETSVDMTDLGPAAGATAGTRLYSASIPTAALGAGQMLRWRVVATDNTGVPGTAPAFLDALDNEEYYGTVAADSSIESNLPVLYWFTANQAAAENAVGTRNSFFFKAIGDPGVGRFYDNVEINLHGQSSSGFPKKSYDLDFNEDNRFTWDITQKRVKDINLLTNWGDKSKTRNVMAHEAFAAAGSVAHWGRQVRVQQVTPTNAATPANHFFSIADMLEDGDDDFLERNGLSGDGALYKVYDSIGAVANGEKKTRLNEDKADYQAFIDGLNLNNSLAARRAYAYDNMDLPQCVSYFVGCIITSHQDHGHKNLYVYRDSTGTKEWSILPWDVDLSWGRTWQDNPGYFTDTIFVDNELDQYKQVVQNKGENRLYSLIVGHSDVGRLPATEFRDMVLRRLRTVMDGYFSAPNVLENRFAELANLMDPPAIGTSDADRDYTKWSFWGNSGGASGGVALRFHISEISGVNRYLAGRRAFLNTATLAGATVPASQPANASTLVTIETVDFKPAANQEEEYFVIRNANAYSVDISGWQITGAVNLVFKPGTVLPPGSGVTENLGDLYVAKNPAIFRQRSTVSDDGQPAAGRFRFVQGPYSGQLSARGETIELRNAAGTLLKTKTWTAAPTPAQDQLRITELNYAPTAPTPSESAALQGVTEGDFEYVELQNIGATPLTVTGAKFVSGIDFTFPARVLAPGERVLIIANLAAFRLRYGASLDAQIVGVFNGNLANGGENLQIVDAIGENVLDFSYDNAWFPPSDEGGHSLVVRNPSPNWSTYGLPQNWALSGAVGGSPGATDASFAQVYEGWRLDYFTEAELPTASSPNLPAAFHLDIDLDGLNNFTEYAFGRLPRTADNGTPLTTPSVVTDGASDYLAITFVRRHNALDLTYIIETTGDLATGVWHPATILVGIPTDLGNGLEQVTYRDAIPRTPDSPRFIRVRALK